MSYRSIISTLGHSANSSMKDLLAYGANTPSQFVKKIRGLFEAADTELIKRKCRLISLNKTLHLEYISFLMIDGGVGISAGLM